MANLPMTNPSVDKFMDITGYYGAEVSMDSQGRILIPQRLREAVQIRDEVNVMGKTRFLSLWNDENYKAKRLNQPFSKDDARELSQFGV